MKLRTVVADVVAIVLLAVLVPVFVLPVIAWDSLKQLLGGKRRRP